LLNILAVIPARGGSKGIPDKNIIEVAGLPLIAHTIKSARRSKLISHLIVSTDSEKIAGIAREYGALVPFIRPEELATDSALSVDVLSHAIYHEEVRLGLEFDYVVLLQPTSPLKSETDIDGAIETVVGDRNCDTAVTVVDVGANHPARMYQIINGELISVIREKTPMMPRQELPAVYIRNGAVYAFRRDVIDKYGAILGAKIKPYIMPMSRSINIDGAADILLAEYYFSMK
jgi:CMP-N,N'-diacetyllegionaminic acid synthase